MQRRSLQFLCLGLLSVFLMYCGTGGNNAPNTGAACTTNEDCISSEEVKLECRAKKCRTIEANRAPEASISFQPSSPGEGEKITLDGSRSSDPDNNNLTYKWTLKSKPSGSKADLADADKVNAHFTADVPGDFVVSLIVTDDHSEKKSSLEKEVTIKVRSVTNQKPVADAGVDQTVGPNSAVTLDGSKSFDPDKHTLTYKWDFQSKPQGSQATLDKSDTAAPTFTADKEGRYILTLVVTDSRGDSSDPDSVTIISMTGFDKTPKVTKVTPNEGLLGEKIKIVVTGSDFVAGAEIRMGSRTFQTNFKSATELEANLDLSGLTPKEYEFHIVNPNGVASKPPVPFTVKGIEKPVLTSLTPPKSYTGLQVTVTAKGNNFFDGNTEVLFESVPLPTTIKSKTELEFSLDLRKTPIGEYSVKIRNNPGSLISDTELKFRVDPPPPKPVLRVLNPPSALEKQKLPFSVHGIGFDRGAVIVIDGKEIKTRYIRRDELQVDPELDLDALKLGPGTYEVWVRNPGNSDSNKESFRISSIDPTPQLLRILPFTLYLDENMENVAVYGLDIKKGAKLILDGKEITETAGPFGQLRWRSDTYMDVRVDLRDSTKWKAGDVIAEIVNPTGKKSNTFKLSITYRIPSLNALIPNAWTTTCDTEVEVHGINFVPKAEVHFGTTVYSQASTTNKLTYVNDRLMKFQLPATKLSAQTYQVTIKNGQNASTAPEPFKIDTSKSLTPFPQYANPSVGQAETKVSAYIYPESGTNYQSIKPGAVVLLDGKKMQTICSASSLGYCYSLEVVFDLTGFKPGDYDLVVANPCNVKSSPITFTVEPPPEPYIAGFQPSSAKPGDKVKILIKGGNFTKQHEVIWNGAKIKSIFKSDKEIETDGVVDFSTAKFGDQNVEVKIAGGVVAKAKFSIVSSFVPIINDISNNVQQRGRTLTNMQISGTGFVLTSLVYVDGQLASSRYVSATELLLTGFDATNLKEGAYHIQVKNGSRVSNLFPIFLTPVPAPRINYIRPASVVAGSTNSLKLYVYGLRFSTSPAATVVFTGPDKKDLSSRFKSTTSFPSSSYIPGDLDISGLATGRYTVQVKNPSGELSNSASLNLTPPPPPVANSLNPSFVFRGVSNQRIQVIGSNFVTGDLIVFNDNALNRIPGTVKSSGSLEFPIDLTKLKASGDYNVYVLRCLDAGCTKFQKTSTVKLKIQDPACALINCKTEMLPAGSEDCDSAAGVCRPKCTTNANCTALDAKATWTCKNNFCQ